MKKTVSIIILSVLCIGNIHAETIDSVGFERVGEDVSETLTILTYNVQKKKYSRHAEIIKSTGADVVAIQEIAGQHKFNLLRKKTGLKGIMCATVNLVVFKYGIALLWNEAKLGNPVTVTCHKIETPGDENDNKRGYIIAEFNNFYIIATHLSTDIDENKKMAEIILKEDIITNYRKPVYIAGDLNRRPMDGIPREKDGYETITFLKANGFQLLNDMDAPEQATRESGGRPDLIFVYNQNPNHEITDRGVPADADRTFTISDHLPYFVKVKLK